MNLKKKEGKSMGWGNENDRSCRRGRYMVSYSFIFLYRIEPYQWWQRKMPGKLFRQPCSISYLHASQTVQYCVILYLKFYFSNICMKWTQNIPFSNSFHWKRRMLVRKKPISLRTRRNIFRCRPIAMKIISESGEQISIHTKRNGCGCRSKEKFLFGE